MKKVFFIIFVFFIIGSFVGSVRAESPIQLPTDPPLLCPAGSCPVDLVSVYTDKGEKCAKDYAEFQQDPVRNHLWVEDPAITSQGRTDERAREFIYWAVSKNAIDDHPVLKQIWGTASVVAYVLTVLVAAILGLGLIVNQRTHFNSSVKIWPIVGKIFGVLVGIAFSATLVILAIQFSEVIMKFFNEQVGGSNLFNIYFSGSSTEANYTTFIGCRDLNYRVQEGVGAEIFMLKLTNITYYAMGVMLLLRKIVLWFMLFVSPFVPILFSFGFIRNIAWIWIGVFFQWLFYGPLFALFLGGITKIWSVGIPFTFNFSRSGKPEGYIYPTAINILYGGPAQHLGALTNANYVDTYAEYIISLIMLWAVTLLPWLLLRIFRDYCCDGINASKNILLSMYDHMRNGTPLQPSPSPLSASTMGTSLKLQKDIEVPVRVKIETAEEIHKSTTEDIIKSLHLQASKISDIARIETNIQTQETVKKNLNFLANPVKADTPTERQRYMNLRTELFNRAVKEDTAARQLLVATSATKVDQFSKREELLETAPKLIPVTHIVSFKVHLPQEKISSVNGSFIGAVAKNGNAVNSIAQASQVPADKVLAVLESFKQNMAKSPLDILKQIQEETGLTKEQIALILKQVTLVSEAYADIPKEIAEKEELTVQMVKEVIAQQIPLIVEPEKNIEQAVAIPSTVSIEDYEEVKKMWKEQYEKGEVPVTENIMSRKQWVEQDTIFITNTLNKLLSVDGTLKQQGLDDLAYILPIFLINDLKGEELVVYLKAKLEAAKEVSQGIDKEKEIAEKLKIKGSEEFVDVDRSKHEDQPQTMQMSQDLPADQPKKTS